MLGIPKSPYASFLAAGCTLGTNAAAATFYSRDFGLDPSGVASIFAWAALGGVASLILSRAMDTVGRWRIAFASALGLSIATLGSALAPSLALFIAAQMAASCAAATLLNSATVIISEELGPDLRARGQALAGVCFPLGVGTAMVLVAALESLGLSWRFAWGALSAGTVALAVSAYDAPEGAVFRAETGRASRPRGRMSELFSPAYRGLVLAAIANGVLMNLASLATSSWFIFHQETTLRLTPTIATTVVIGGGAIGLTGYPLGAVLSRAIGRRATYGVMGAAALLFQVLFFRVPGDLGIRTPLALLAVHASGATCFGAAVVALRTALTELFPTRLRGTQQGVSSACLALGALLAQVATAELVPRLGGLVPTVSLLGLVGLPGIVVLCSTMRETSGTRLDE